MASSNNHYEILGISNDATKEQIRKAYHKKALQTHPDKGGHPSLFRPIQEAYKVLSDPVKRKEYDVRFADQFDPWFADQFAAQFNPRTTTFARTTTTWIDPKGVERGKGKGGKRGKGGRGKDAEDKELLRQMVTYSIVEYIQIHYPDGKMPACKINEIGEIHNSTISQHIRFLGRIKIFCQNSKGAIYYIENNSGGMISLTPPPGGGGEGGRGQGKGEGKHGFVKSGRGGGSCEGGGLKLPTDEDISEALDYLAMTLEKGQPALLSTAGASLASFLKEKNWRKPKARWSSIISERDSRFTIHSDCDLGYETIKLL